MGTSDELTLHRPSTATAAASALTMIAMAALTLPAVEQSWGERAWLVAALLAGMATLFGFTALLLALRASASRESPLAWFSGGYAFTAILVVFHLLNFPGVVVPTATERVDQVAMWFWVLWHTGLPVFVLVAMAELSLLESRPGPARRPARPAGAPLVIGIATALGLAIALQMADGRLPAIVDSDNDYQRLIRDGVGRFVIVLNLAALATLGWVTRLRGIVYQWLALALLAFNLDVLLTFAGEIRFTAGWYMARLMSLLASGSLLVALMVEHFRLLSAAHDRADVLDQLAHRDVLTGIFNRRYFEAHFAHEFQRAKRYGHALSVLMIDLDHFKKINDRYGHLAGDACLKAVAGVLAGRVKRAGEFAARYGGEEFVVVLPETPKAAAEALAEEIRRETEALKAMQRAPYAVTVSVGVATSNAQDLAQSFSVLVSAADNCLYQAKREGRNRVVATELDQGPRRPLRVVAS